MLFSVWQYLKGSPIREHAQEVGKRRWVAELCSSCSSLSEATADQVNSAFVGVQADMSRSSLSAGHRHP